MDNLDFSGLTDDQLVTLIRAACAEARTRGAATEAAARDVYLDEVERARIARAAELIEGERLRSEEAARVAREAADRIRREADQKKVQEVAEGEEKLWGRRKGIAEALDAAGWDCKGDQIVVWMSAAKEKRVFLQQLGYGGATYATLYVTGNCKKTPDSVSFGSPFNGKPELQRRVAAVLRSVAREWNTFKVALAQALAWSGAAIPLQHLEKETAT